MKRTRRNLIPLIVLPSLANGCIVPNDFAAATGDVGGSAGASASQVAGNSAAGQTVIGTAGAGNPSGGRSSQGGTGGIEIGGTANAGAFNAGASGWAGEPMYVNGGASTGGSAGAATGGKAIGGTTNVTTTGGRAGNAATAGASVGGVPAGGNANGGGINGGATTGGSAAGGVANGGVATGGSANGGVATGGSANGGVATGGSAIAGTAGKGDFPPTILSDCNLLLHMDESSWSGTIGEVKDSSGLGNHGTATTGASVTNSPAKFFNAGAFDGIGVVDVGDNASLRPSGALTVAAWFNATTVDGIERGIVVKRWGWQDNDAFSIFIWGDEPRSPINTLIYVDIDDDNNRFTSDAAKPLVANTWYHVVVVYDGTLGAEQRVRLYVNGTLDGAPRYEASSSVPATYNGPLQIGNLRSGGQPFIGSIDEVAMWRRALSPTEVTALYWATGPL